MQVVSFPARAGHCEGALHRVHRFFLCGQDDDDNSHKNGTLWESCQVYTVHCTLYSRAKKSVPKKCPDKSDPKSVPKICNQEDIDAAADDDVAADNDDDEANVIVMMMKML